MSLFITSLNSGSNGNCYYVGNDTDAVLIDAGLSCRQTETRMRRLGLSMDRVRAIFVSHEHSDHVMGIFGLAKKYHLPVYITPETLRHSRLTDVLTTRPLCADEPVWVGELCVRAFRKEHDAADPHSFTVTHGKRSGVPRSGAPVTVGVFTDIGQPCHRLIDHFGQCHAAFLEANYDEDLLEHGRYPAFLKQRIRGGRGHLSNRQALELFRRHRPAFMSHVLLAHLSHQNNSPQIASELFQPHLGNTQLVIAPRHKETPVFEIGV